MKSTPWSAITIAILANIITIAISKKHLGLEWGAGLLPRDFILLGGKYEIGQEV